ncbi:MAG: serine/threonine protein kinase [Candidatus Riflebacteria bacterium]|nr:serine/threonine protein kinase [Candidatus Riflebacteria bacterium]
MKLLGEGGMGEVFLARDRQLGVAVALKVVRDDVARDLLLRFERECTILRGISHPAIVPVLDWGRLKSGSYFYTMPHIESVTSLAAWLRAHFDRSSAPPGRGAIETIVADVASALDHIHERGVFHRDVKPSNILVLPDGRAMLIDFGLAGMVNSALTTTGVILGTMNYMAPEQAEGLEVVAQTDIHGLGLVLYELATGVRAVADAMDHIRKMSRGVRSFPPPSTRSPHVGPGLDEVILKATDLDPGRRHRSGRELVAALKALAPEAWARDAAVAAGSTPVVAPVSAGATPLALPRGTTPRTETLKGPARLTNAPGSPASPEPGLGARDRRPVVLAAGLALVLVSTWFGLSRRPALEGAPGFVLGFARAQLVARSTVPCKAAVRYSSADAREKVVSETAPTCDHVLMLEPLAPGGSYRYELSLDGVPAVSGVLIGPDLPQLKDVAAETGRSGVRLTVELTSAARGTVRVGQGETVEATATLSGIDATETLELPRYEPTGPVQVQIELESALNEPLLLPRRTVTLGGPRR